MFWPFTIVPLTVCTPRKPIGRTPRLETGPAAREEAEAKLLAWWHAQPEFVPVVDHGAPAPRGDRDRP